MRTRRQFADRPAAATARTSPLGGRRLSALLAAALLLWLGLALPAGAQEEAGEGATATAGAQPTSTEQAEPTEPAAPAEDTEDPPADDVPAEPSELQGADDGEGATLQVVEELNLRAEPSLEAEILTVMATGASVTVRGDGAAQDDFLPVTFDDQDGWAHAAYLVAEGDNLATVQDGQDGLNLRAEPSTDAESLLVMPAGAQVRVFGAAEDADGTAWSRVRYDDTSGWAAAEFLAEGAAATATDTGEAATTTGADDAAALAGQERLALVDVNLRAGSSADAEILLVIPAGGSLTLTGEAWENGYVTAAFEGTAGWVAAEFIARPDELDASATSTPAAPAEETAPAEEAVATEAAEVDGGAAAEVQAGEASDLAGQTRVTLDDLNLRAGPSVDAEVLLVIPVGASVTLTGEGAENGYVTVGYEGTAGWVDAAFLGE